MLKISIQEAAAFDSLSIFLLKSVKNNNEINNKNYNFLLRELYSEIGIQKTIAVLNSQEYKDLYKINELIFNLVDKVKKNPCIGDQIDKANFDRFKKKQELQSKFFKSSLFEQKFGYM